MTPPREDPRPAKARRRRMSGLIFGILIAAWVVVALTIQVRAIAPGSFVARNMDQIIAVETTIFGIVLVEVIGKLLVSHYSNRDIFSVGIALRAVLRVLGYTIIAVVGVSLLAQNPTLAISVGGVTGVVVGFSAQSIIANIVAGMYLAIGRPFKIGDKVIVSGLSGAVIDLGLTHTVLDAGDTWVYAPNSVLLTTVIQRRKHLAEIPSDRSGDGGAY